MSSSALVPADKQFVGMYESLKRTVSGVFRHSPSGARSTPIRESRLLTRWQEAERANREANWNQLPEDTFDQLEEAGEQLTDDDARFLARYVVSDETPTFAAIAAIRLLGILVEEELTAAELALPTLRDTLFHNDAQRRYFAIKALWQAEDKGALPSLQRVVERDSEEQVRALAERAIAVLS